MLHQHRRVRYKPKVVCETPWPTLEPTRITRWKFEAVRHAILEVLPDEGEGMPFEELVQQVKAALAPRRLRRLGSVEFYVATVRLDLIVRGEVEPVGNRAGDPLRRTAKGTRYLEETA